MIMRNSRCLDGDASAECADVSAPGHHVPDRLTISVVICAYSDERWESLLTAISSCRAQTTVPSEIVVVIDYNEPLRARLEAVASGVSVIRNVEERGLSGSRNTGVAATRGDIIAFLDDDAIAECCWLEHLVSAYRTPDVFGVGGWVEPLWPNVRRPPRFPPEFDWVVGCSYRGLPTDAQPVRNMIGANMSLRRKVFDEVGGFRSGIGRVGSRPMGCEETELCIRAGQRWPTGTIIFQPRARVGHQVSADRTTWRYFRSRCYAEGLSKALVTGQVGGRDGLASERAHALRALPRGVLTALGEALSRREVAGVARAAAIVIGLLITAFGYAAGWSRLQWGGAAS
jgi:GT2 family glycosyltransferase